MVHLYFFFLKNYMGNISGIQMYFPYSIFFIRIADTSAPKHIHCKMKSLNMRWKKFVSNSLQVHCKSVSDRREKICHKFKFLGWNLRLNYIYLKLIHLIICYKMIIYLFFDLFFLFNRDKVFHLKWCIGFSII